MFTKENYFEGGFGDFKQCKSPKRKPDYVSYSKKYAGQVSSVYWYGTDTNGEYVIRMSQHWGIVAHFNKWLLDGNTQNYTTAKAGKCYFKNFQKRKTKHPSLVELIEMRHSSIYRWSKNPNIKAKDAKIFELHGILNLQ